MIRGGPVTSAGESLGRAPGLQNGRYATGRGYVYIRNGLKHRERGPAETRNDGYEAWYFLGRLHRVGGPAVTYASGKQEWWENGKLLKSVDPSRPAPGTKMNLQKNGRRG